MMITVPLSSLRCNSAHNPKRIRRIMALIAGIAGLTTIAACSGTVSQAPKASVADVATVTQDDVENTVHICSSCHGLYGRSISPTFPRLAGQQEAYLEAQLTAFRDHTRADPHAHTYMWGMAAHLSDPMIHGLATYFASQTPAAGSGGDPGLMAAGEKIFQEGVADRDIPACQACHGVNAEGMATIPRLAGQHHDYLVEQLQNFASNARANEIMHDNAKNMTNDEIEQLATYLASK